MVRLVVVAVICAVMLPAAAFTIYTVPLAALPAAEHIVWAGRVADFPVAVFNRLLPESLRTHMTFSLQCRHTYCFPRDYHIERTHYQLVGAAAYLVLFALGGVAVASMRN